MAFPVTIRTPSSISRRKHKAQNKGNFEAGYVQSVVRNTRGRYRFILNWKNMPIDELVILETYFENNQGSTFSWTHPITETTYTVRFSTDEINADYIEGSVTDWAVSIELEEQ